MGSLSAATTAEVKARLRADFPAWSIITTDRGRWWATRNPVEDPATRRRVDYTVTAVDADTAAQLRAKLCAADRDER